MPTTQFPRVPSAPSSPDLRSLTAYVSQMANLFAVLSKELDFLLNGSLDVQNIRAKSITSESIQAGAITTDELAADAVTADKINVNELSAISADLGTITAGLVSAITIIGSYIATSNGTFPYCEMSTTDNLFRAYGASADEYVGVVTDYLGNGPGSVLVNGGLVQGGHYATSLAYHVAGVADLYLEAGTDIHMVPNGTTGVIFPSFSEIYSNAASQSLQAALNAKANNSGVSGTFYVATTSGGPATHPITVTNGVITA